MATGEDEPKKRERDEAENRDEEPATKKTKIKITRMKKRNKNIRGSLTRRQWQNGKTETEQLVRTSPMVDAGRKNLHRKKWFKNVCEK